MTTYKYSRPTTALLALTFPFWALPVFIAVGIFGGLYAALGELIDFVRTDYRRVAGWSIGEPILAAYVWLTCAVFPAIQAYFRTLWSDLRFLAQELWFFVPFNQLRYMRSAYWVRVGFKDVVLAILGRQR